ncbi:M23 family metallopeptidase [Novosphingobium resinovorum]|uniref:M23 family metallopeptidase n=1 Tax=Novosphingobium resinovorum TaxID=158500 RepID=UPI002ED30454|nr:M23 family metallopeptidase [Novosphingobium resinovorum]
MVGKLKAGQHVDPEDEFSRLLPSVDRREAVETLMQAAEAAAGEVQQSNPQAGLRMIDNLLGWNRTQLATAASVSAPTAPTPSGLISPFPGFDVGKRSGRMGEARSGGSAHNGEDFPAPVGTPIVAPMGGEVVASMRNARGGNQVRVRMDDGSIVGFAHLSSRGVEVGQRVEAGAQLGLSGNTGKSTGPHVHMTMEVNGKKVSPSDHFARQAPGAPEASEAFAAAFGSDGAAGQPQADAAGLEQPQIASLTGPLSLAPSQVLHLQEFRRTYSQRAEAEAERQRTDRHATTSAGVLGRLAGVGGAYPTTTEVRSLMRSDAISPQQGMQFLSIIDSDARQARSEARQALAWRREDQRENKETYLRGQVSSLLGPVYAGRATITETTGKLLAMAASERDPEVRQALTHAVHGELSQLQTLRQKGPEYQGAGSDLDGWETAYSGQLGGVRLPRGLDTQGARALIRSKLDEVRTELGRGDVPPEKVSSYMDRAERRLDLWFTQTFPPRAVKR